MKKILFIIQSYPSERSANVLCDEKVMFELLKSGQYEVHCSCYRYEGQKKEEVVNGIHVHRFDRGPFWYLFTWAIHRQNKKISKIIIGLNRLFMRIKQALTIPIFPFYEPFLSHLNYKESYKIVRKEKIDVVVSEHNGIDTLYAGYRIKKKDANIKFVPIFWDPLSGGLRPKYLPKKYIDKKKIAFEKKVLETCDIAIAMETHEKHLKNVQSVELIRKIQFLNIPRLSLLDTSFVSQRNKTYSVEILFAGNIAMRNPKFIMDLLKKVECDKKIKLSFFVKKESHDNLLKIYDSEMKSHFELNVHDFVPAVELLKYQKDADFLLCLGCNNANAVSSKIFEYISLRKPIIYGYVIDDDPGLPTLKKYDRVLLLNERQNAYELKNLVEEFLVDNSLSELSNAELSNLFRTSFASSYVDVIDGLFAMEKNR